MNQSNTYTPSTEMRKCPNPECGNEEVQLAYSGSTNSNCVKCPVCSMQGPRDTDVYRAVELWNALTTESSWISVEDELPEMDERVLICFGYDYVGKPLYTVAKKANSTDKQEWTTVESCIRVYAPCWRPLPDGPPITESSKDIQSRELRTTLQIVLNDWCERTLADFSKKVKEAIERGL